MKECFACGIPVQGIFHDMSKFGFTEFVSSAKYFQGNRSPIEAEKETTGYSKAWLHHKGHNKHHWEYWIDFDDNGNVITNDIPNKYVVEMVCDWIGAGKAYDKDEWTIKKPLEYYNKVRQGRHFHENVEAKILLLLEMLADYGSEEFHFIAQTYIKQKNEQGEE